MEMEILYKLEEILYKKYKYLREGFIFIEIYEGIIVLNWTVENDLNINYYKVRQIINFMLDYLKKQKQEGFIYTANLCIKV